MTQKLDFPTQKWDVKKIGRENNCWERFSGTHKKRSGPAKSNRQAEDMKASSESNNVRSEDDVLKDSVGSQHRCVCWNHRDFEDIKLYRQEKTETT